MVRKRKIRFIISRKVAACDYFKMLVNVLASPSLWKESERKKHEEVSIELMNKSWFT